MTKKRRILYFIVMLTILLIFTESLLQLFYRVANGSYLFSRMALPIYEKSDHRVYRVKPKLTFRHSTNEYDVTYYTNNMGMRTDKYQKDIEITKDEQTFRILFLGPSFTFGWANNYEDTYTSIISKNITVAGKKIEVMNLGTPAQPINYQLCWLKKIGYKYDPDFIIQTVYGDPRSIPYDCQLPTNKPNVGNNHLFRGVSWKDKFIKYAKNSAIVFYGWYFYQYYSPYPNSDEGLGTELYENKPHIPTYDLKEIKFETYLNYISFVRTVLKRDVPILFSYIPYSYVVRPSDIKRFSHRKEKNNPYKLRLLAKETEKVLKQNNINFVNTTDDLISKDKSTRMYHFLDIHLTPTGNQIVANTTLSVINEMSLDSNDSKGNMLPE